jgi:hypothetical protein
MNKGGNGEKEKGFIGTGYLNTTRDVIPTTGCLYYGG